MHLLPKNYIYCTLAVFLTTFLLFPTHIVHYEFPVYRVVLDPGHGGLNRQPQSIHGDRYDPVSKQYLDTFREGAKFGTFHEHEIMYSIAQKVERILYNAGPDGNFAEFDRLLEKYGKKRGPRIQIITMMSRPDSRGKNEGANPLDPNAEFRLYDYPDAKGRMRPGRLSRITSFSPQLVVALHCDLYQPSDHRGYNVVISPPYSFLYKGLLFARGDIKDKTFFYKSPYAGWFLEKASRREFDWFIEDSLTYFTGYGLNDDGTRDTEGFRGYKFNMFNWAYRDKYGWEEQARLHRPGSAYDINYYTFNPQGKYWDRERSAYEEYKRDGGLEGSGGDNHYVSAELIRYVLYSLKMSRNDDPAQRMGDPFITIWNLPMLLNAITAYIELGYLSVPRFRYLFTEHQNEIAEGLAVGIYSLFAGITPDDPKYRYAPRGKKLDLEKYKVSDSETYFDLSLGFQRR